MAIRNEIVRGFRNRTGNYLLVLTDDYDRLDFVLVERYTQTITTQDETFEVQTLFPGKAPALVRPRVLQVLRRSPGDVAMRVLRRFTYTEGDTIAQYEKLLNAYIVAAWSEPFFLSPLCCRLTRSGETTGGLPDLCLGAQPGWQG